MTDSPSTNRSGRTLDVLRVSHILLGVSDLAESTDFYERLGPLRRVAEGRSRLGASAVVEADGPLDVQWRAFDDGTGGDPVRVVLAQWHNPSLVGTAYEDVACAGLIKLAFRNPDTKAKLARLRELGIPHTNPEIVRGYVSVLDPDGTVVSFPPGPSLAAEHTFHVYVGSHDYVRYLRFIDDILGFEYWMKNVPSEPKPTSQGPGGDMAQWNSHFMRHRSDRRFTFDIGQFVQPSIHGEPHRALNSVGIAAIGLEVADLDAAVGVLGDRLSGWSHTEAKLWGGVEEWVDESSGIASRVLNVSDADGNLLQFVERPGGLLELP
ncbi:VOC family protein [Streptomyces sp. WG-D5]